VRILFEEMVFDLRDTPARAGPKLIHCDSRWEASGHITATHRRCSDDTCPAAYDTGGPALIAVQGSSLTGPKIRAGWVTSPAHEEVVVLSCSLLESYATKRR
jgi:hypothetical protein